MGQLVVSSGWRIGYHQGLRLICANMEDCTGLVEALEEQGVLVHGFIYPIVVRRSFHGRGGIPCNEASIAGPIFHPYVFFDAYRDAVL